MLAEDSHWACFHLSCRRLLVASVIMFFITFFTFLIYRPAHITANYINMLHMMQNNYILLIILIYRCFLSMKNGYEMNCRFQWWCTGLIPVSFELYNIDLRKTVGAQLPIASSVCMGSFNAGVLMPVYLKRYSKPSHVTCHQMWH